MHNHKPTAAALQLVIEAFDRAPFVAKSGARGINLHIDAGPNSIMKLRSTTWGDTLSKVHSWPEKNVNFYNSGTDKNGQWIEPDKIKDNPINGFMKTDRARIFRYCLCVHQLNVNISPTFIGKARAPIPNSDFLISWGSQVFTGINWAVNAMHEPGHCLGLNHGGDQVNAADTFNNKPNYLSIMNYNFCQRITEEWYHWNRRLLRTSFALPQSHQP